MRKNNSMFVEKVATLVLILMKVADANGFQGCLYVCRLPRRKYQNVVIKSKIAVLQYNIHFKVEDVRENTPNYSDRLISLRLICGKILEKIIFDAMYKHLSDNGLMLSNQSSFLSGPCWKTCILRQRSQMLKTMVEQ